MLDTSTIDKFQAGLRGELIRRNDPQYDEARKLYNAMIDKRPLLIARCADIADIISAVNFARENNLLTAVRAVDTMGPDSEAATTGWSLTSP